MSNSGWRWKLVWDCKLSLVFLNATKYWAETVSAEVSALASGSYYLKSFIPLHHATTFLILLCSLCVWYDSKALIETNRLLSFASQNSKYSRSYGRSKFSPWIYASKSRASIIEISFFILYLFIRISRLRLWLFRSFKSLSRIIRLALLNAYLEILKFLLLIKISTKILDLRKKRKGGMTLDNSIFMKI